MCGRRERKCAWILAVASAKVSLPSVSTDFDLNVLVIEAAERGVSS
jgi:hypothetical protein